MGRRAGWILIGLVVGWAGSAQGGGGLVVEVFSGDAVRGISFEEIVNKGAGVYGGCAWGSGVKGQGRVGVEGKGYWGVVGNGSGFGVRADSDSGYGVYATSDSGDGVYAESNSGDGVNAFSSDGYGVLGESLNKDGVAATAYADNKSGIFAVNDNLLGHAGYFRGRVHVTDQLSTGGGSFKIDHPLDPENRYLYHSLVESPDMMNVYNGNVVLDRHGEAWVELPQWFEALNSNFRYQLTPIGGFAPVYIAEKISGNRFLIAGGEAGLEVSWQVTGVRQDPWAEAHRIPVEEDKPDIELGTYLHPAEWGQPTDLDVQWVHRPELMAKWRRLEEGQP